MIILLLILILLAILYSTEAGREFLAEAIALPFKIILYPLRMVNESKHRVMLEQSEKKRTIEISDFLKTLNNEDRDLINDEFVSPLYFI
jgi:hypothetical protein